MNAQLSRKSLEVNSGKVADTETPLFVGLTGVRDKINGRTQKCAISLDRTWLWVRFPQPVSQEWNDKLVSYGLRFMPKRMGWSGVATQFLVEKLRGIGAQLPDYARLPLPEDGTVVMPVKQHNVRKDEGVDMGAPAERTPKGERKTGKRNQNTKQVQSDAPIVSTIMPTQEALYNAGVLPINTHDSEGYIIEFEVTQPQPAPVIAAPTQEATPDLAAEVAELRALVAQLISKLG